MKKFFLQLCVHSDHRNSLNKVFAAGFSVVSLLFAFSVVDVCVGAGAGVGACVCVFLPSTEYGIFKWSHGKGSNGRL